MSIKDDKKLGSSTKEDLLNKQITSLLPLKGGVKTLHVPIDSELHKKVKAKLKKTKDRENTWRDLIEASFRKFLGED